MKIEVKLISLLKLDMTKPKKIDLDKLEKSKKEKSKAKANDQKINKHGSN